MKLNLGAGEEKIPGFISVDFYNVHADIKCDVRKLPYEDNSAEEVRAYHLIEHFNFKEAYDIVREWHRVLQPNGILSIETPDFLGSCKKFVESSEAYRVEMYGHFFSTPWVNEGLVHKFLYTETQLFWLLTTIGFKDIHRCEPDSHAFLHVTPIKELFLNVKAIK